MANYCFLGVRLLVTLVAGQWTCSLLVYLGPFTTTATYHFDNIFTMRLKVGAERLSVAICQSGRCKHCYGINVIAREPTTQIWQVSTIQGGQCKYSMLRFLHYCYMATGCFEFLLAVCLPTPPLSNSYASLRHLCVHAFVCVCVCAYVCVCVLQFW